MANAESLELAVLIELHLGREQLGPGSEASTERAFRLLPADLPLGSGARILDFGCGTGRQTLTLARLAPDAEILGVELIPPMVEFARERIAAAGLTPRVSVREGSMIDDALTAERASLIWSEGAIYNVGVEAGLRAWSEYLLAGGCVAFTEASWLGEARPSAARRFWKAAYPQMKSIEENLETIAACGYAPLAHFTLPASDWWAYYDGLEPSYRALREKYAGRHDALAALEAQRAEQDLYRAHSDAYGYEFYVARFPRTESGARRR
jgi:SAM-dependent methyltransferase